MTVRFAQVLVGLIAVLLTAAPGRAAPKGQEQDPPEQAQQARKALTAYLQQKFKGAEGANVDWLGAAAVRAAFPGEQFFAVWFRQHPVARLNPEGLNGSNLFAVTGDGKVEHLREAKALEAFFRKKLGAVKDAGSAKTAVNAWLSLATAFLRDGFFRFEVLEKEAEAQGSGPITATGRAMVVAGGNGEVLVKMVFGADGKLQEVDPQAKVRPGPRPICQATKLLDGDPLVRRMAEQDLLIMGLAARAYLMEQRRQAAPELRQAIDRMWQRIVAEGW